MTEVAGSRALRPVLLLYAIACNGGNRLRLLHVSLGFGQEALVVFSSWRAAQNFYLSEVFRGEWYTRECSAGELISLLLGNLAIISVTYGWSETGGKLRVECS